MVFLASQEMNHPHPFTIMLMDLKQRKKLGKITVMSLQISNVAHQKHLLNLKLR